MESSGPVREESFHAETNVPSRAEKGIPIKGCSGRHDSVYSAPPSSSSSSSSSSLKFTPLQSPEAPLTELCSSADNGGRGDLQPLHHQQIGRSDLLQGLRIGGEDGHERQLESGEPVALHARHLPAALPDPGLLRHRAPRGRHLRSPLLSVSHRNKILCGVRTRDAAHGRFAESHLRALHGLCPEEPLLRDGDADQV